MTQIDKLLSNLN